MKPNKVHCFFEQSGTFKNEFIKAGIDAFDYDIQNEYKQTDYIVDLFKEIENQFLELFSSGNKIGIFKNIDKKDLCFAFFPCIYFTGVQNIAFTPSCTWYDKLEEHQKIKKILQRADQRHYFYNIIYKMVAVFQYFKIPLIIENPYNAASYIAGYQNFYKPSLIDKNRMTRGDYFVKPTAFWFFNCEPHFKYQTIQNDKKQKRINDIKTTSKNGLCSKERSEISSDYARNFIYDFVLNQKQDKLTQLSIF